MSQGQDDSFVDVNPSRIGPSDLIKESLYVASLTSKDKNVSLNTYKQVYATT